VPGTNGFIGELLILSGAFGANVWVGVAAVIGAMLAAVYMLSLFKSVALGPIVTFEEGTIWDIGRREGVCLLALAVFIFWIGLYPKPFLGIMAPALGQLLGQLGQGG